ncbi:unnamed protein product, partial [Coccothraustes coccothraustes]
GMKPQAANSHSLNMRLTTSKLSPSLSLCLSLCAGRAEQPQALLRAQPWPPSHGQGLSPG